MAAIVVGISGDEAKLWRAFQKLADQQVALQGKLKETGEEGKKAGDKAGSGFKELDGVLAKNLSGIKDLAMGMVAGGSVVAMATKAVTAGWTEWTAQIKEAGEAAHKYNQQVIADMSKIGDLARGAEITARLKAVPGATKASAEEAYAAVSGAMPGAVLERRLGIAEAVAPGAAIGLNVAELGARAGRLADVMPGKTPEQVAGMSLELGHLAGADVEELTGNRSLKAMRIMQESKIMAPEEGLAWNVAASRRKFRPDILTTLTEALTQKPQIPESPKGPLQQGNITLEADLWKYTQADPKERMKMLRENEGIRKQLLGEKAFDFMQIKPEEVAGYAGQLRAAQAPGAGIAAELAAAAGTPGGADILLGYEKKIEKSRIPGWKEKAEEGEAGGRWEDYIQNRMAAMSPSELTGYWSNRAQAQTKAGTRKFFGAQTPYYEMVAEYTGDLGFIEEEKRLRQTERESADPGRRFQEKMPAAGEAPPWAAPLDRAAAKLDRAADKLGRPGPTLARPDEDR